MFRCRVPKCNRPSARRRNAAPVARPGSHRVNLSYRETIPRLRRCNQVRVSSDIARRKSGWLGCGHRLLVLLAAVALVLLIACANVASSCWPAPQPTERNGIARRTGRRLLTFGPTALSEGLLLAFLGGARACSSPGGRCHFCSRALSPGTLPGSDAIHVDAGVLLFSLGICCFTGIAFGSRPSYASCPHLDVHENLKQGGRGSSEGGRGGRRSRIMVTAEIALALVLMTGAGLLIRSFAALMSVKPGFDSAKVLTFPFNLPTSKYPQPAQRAEFYRQFLEQRPKSARSRVGRLGEFAPSDGVTLVCVLLRRKASFVRVSAGSHHFHARRQSGLFPRAADSFAGGPHLHRLRRCRIASRHRYQPNRRYTATSQDINPLGKHMANSRDRIPLEIVGVVGDVKFNSLNSANSEEMFLPFAQNPPIAMTLVVNVPIPAHSRWWRQCEKTHLNSIPICP